MDSIFDEIDKNRLKDQDFLLAIFWGCLYISLFYVRSFLDSAPKNITGIAGIICWIFFQQCFKVYLKNFSSDNVVKWIKIRIVINTLLLIILIANSLLTGNKSDIYYFGIKSSNVHLVVLFAYWTGILIDLITAILFGIELRKIQNDFIGLLKKTGTIFVYATPFAHLVFVIILFNKPLKEIYYSGKHPLFDVIIDSFSMIPAFFMIKIFSMAYRYKKADYISD